MQDISSIRNNAIKRNNHNSLVTSLKPNKVDTLSSLRVKNTLSDPNEMFIIRSQKEIKKLSLIIADKKKEFEDLIKNTEKIKIESKEYSDEIIKSATKKADDLIKSANAEKNKATAYKNTNIDVKAKLDKIAEKLDKKEEFLKNKASVLESKAIGIQEDDRLVSLNIDRSNNVLGEAKSYLSKSVSIFVSILDLLENITKFEGGLSNEINTTLQKTDKMYNRVSDLMAEIKAGEDYNNNRSKELDTRELFIKDQRIQLEMAKKEILK